MAREPRIQYENAIYHVMSHSVPECDLFTDLDDFRKFVVLLDRTQADYSLKIFAYCLMRTHYHILMQTPLANLSVAMKYLNYVYAVAYNSRNERAGHVLQGRYSYRVIEHQEYFQRVTHYILYNPVAANLVDAPEDWRFSSCRATVGIIPAPRFLDVGGLMELLDGGHTSGFLDFVNQPVENGWEFSDELVLLRPALETIFGNTGRNDAVFESVRRWEYKRAEVAYYLGMGISNIGKILKKFPDSA